MAGDLLIDGIDVYTAYGCILTDNSYQRLIQYPSLKNVQVNDWPEENGIEADTSNVKLDTRQFSINFGIDGSKRNGRLNFITLLSDHAYHDFTFTPLNKTYRLRLISQSGYEWTDRIEVFSLLFADDFPLLDYTYQAPVSNEIRTGYEINGVDFANYGVRINEGTMDEINKMPAVKPNLLINIPSITGTYYDNEWVKFQSKQVNILCTLRADTIDEFWRNYNALLYDISSPGLKSFYTDETGITYECYYNSSTMTAFALDRVWAQFSLNFTFTNNNYVTGMRLISTGGMRFANTGIRKIKVNI